MDTTNQTANAQSDQPPAPTPAKRRRWAIWAVIVLLVIGSGAVGVYLSRHLQHNRDQQTAENAANVSVMSTGFSPATIQVKVGQQITWTNQDSKPHRITSNTAQGDGAFDSEDPLQPQESFTATINKTGTFTYADPGNPTAFKGVIKVIQ